MNFQLPVWFQSIDTSSVGLLDLKNIGIAVGITRLSSPEAKIYALPVWWPPSWIFASSGRATVCHHIPNNQHNFLIFL